ncbi:MAG: ABC transporter permease [Planctomycetaceae bacterium]|nr:ABC transporter permease [Planctomycetaceae bacterium]
MKTTRIRSEHLSTLMWGSASIGSFLVIWYVLTQTTRLGTLIPGPDIVLISLFKGIFGQVGRHSILMHAVYSLGRVLAGFIIGSALGVTVGLIMGWSRVAEAIMAPLYRIIRPIPPIAWIPISIIWFGLGESAKIFLIFLASFANVTLNAWSGARNVDRQLIGAAKMLGANQRQIFFSIVLPSSVPQIFAGLQVAMSSSWSTVLAAEMVRSSEGLGWMIVTGMNNNDIVQILTGIVAIGVVGFLLANIMRNLEAVLCRWNKSGQ